MQTSRHVAIRSQRRLLDDVFKVDEIIVAHERHDGTMSANERRLVFERGDAVAVLLFNADTNAVVLVEQFRVASLIGRRRDEPATTNGWLAEVMAGTINPNETAEAAAIRETLEETGYRIQDPVLIGKFFSSPGATSERIFLYFARVSDAARPGRGGGVGDEDVGIVQIGLDELFDRLAKGLIDDAKLAVAAYWLQSHRGSLDGLRPRRA